MDTQVEQPVLAIAELDLDKFDDLFSDTDSDVSFDSDEEFTEGSEADDSDEFSDSEEDDSEYGSDEEDEEDDGDFDGDDHRCGSFSDIEAEADNSWAEEQLHKQEEATPAISRQPSAAALNMAKIASLALMADSAEAGIIVPEPAKNAASPVEEQQAAAVEVEADSPCAEEVLRKQEEAPTVTREPSVAALDTAKIASLARSADSAEAGIAVPEQTKSMESAVEKLAQLAKNTERSLASELVPQKVTAQEAAISADDSPNQAIPKTVHTEGAVGLDASGKVDAEPPSSPAKTAATSQGSDGDTDSTDSTASETKKKKMKLLPSQKPIPAYIPTKEMDVVEVSHLLNQKRLEHFVKEQQKKGVTEPEKIKEETKKHFVVRQFSSALRPALDSLTGRTFRNWFLPANTIRKTKAQTAVETNLMELLKKQVARKCRLDVMKFDYDMVHDFFVPLTEERIAAHSTTLQRAIQNEDLDTLRRYHAAGSPLNTCNKFGESVLHSVTRRCLHKTLRFLIHECAVDVRVHDDYGRTPMHDCCWTTSPNLEVAKILVETWPDLLYISDMRGFTPLQYVRKEFYPQWGEFLRQLPKECLQPKELVLPKRKRGFFLFGSGRSLRSLGSLGSLGGSNKWMESL